MNLRMVWHSNFYDGPINGLAVLDGEYVWFDMIEENDETGDRIFGLYRLSEENLAELKRRHKDFQINVGFHCDHHPAIFRPFVMEDEKKFKAYFKRKRPKTDLKLKENLIATANWTDFKYWQRPWYGLNNS